MTFFWVTHMRSVLVILDYSRNDYCKILTCLVVLLLLLLPIMCLEFYNHIDFSCRFFFTVQVP